MSTFQVEGFGECNATNFPNNNCLITKLFANNYIQNNGFIIGQVQIFTGTNIPSGWLFCGGQSLDASANPQYDALFNVIGNHYGGTNKTNFCVPNLTQRMPIGSRTILSRHINYQNSNTYVTGGNKTIDSNQMVSHLHSFPSHSHSFSWFTISQSINDSNSTSDNGGTDYCQYAYSNGNNLINGTTGDASPSTSANTGNGVDFLPPFTAVSFIIFYGFYS